MGDVTVICQLPGIHCFGGKRFLRPRLTEEEAGTLERLSLDLGCDYVTCSMSFKRETVSTMHKP